MIRRPTTEVKGEAMPELRTTTDPIAVDYELVASVLDRLGIHKHDDVIRVLIQPKQITVERLRRDEEFRKVPAGDRFATTTNVIAIRRQP